MNRFTHIGRALGEAVLTLVLLPAKHAASLRIMRGCTPNRRPGVLERTEMQHNDFPDTTYTRTWSNGRGEVRFFTQSDGSRLRYYTAGTGPPMVLIHTVRTQLDYFQRVIPLLWDHYTVYALDLPGMGWSDIVPGARY
jgi:hypothetical protein